MADTELLLGLWNRCNNRCRFCYNQTIFHLPKDIHFHLKTCNEILNSVFMEDFNKLRLVGGELFDGAIDCLSVREEFLVILETISNLLMKGQLKSINFLTNLIYKSNQDLRETIKYFEERGLIDKVEISTSYDLYCRFSEESEKWWWDNINWIRKTYPSMKIDVDIVMTRPFVCNVTKEWLDNFLEKLGQPAHVCFNELDTAVIGVDKENSPFSDLFPKRQEFIKFIKNLKDWGHQHLIGIEPGGINPWSRTLSVQYILLEKLPFPVFKNLTTIVPERVDFRQDGYIDSDVPLYSDVMKILEV